MRQKRIQRRLRVKYPYRPLNLGRIAKICGKIFIATGFVAIVTMLVTTLAG